MVKQVCITEMNFMYDIIVIALNDSHVVSLITIFLRILIQFVSLRNSRY